MNITNTFWNNHISFIVILASMLLPALNKARGKAYTITCLSNLKQLGLGVLSYVSDNNEMLPPSFIMWTNGQYAPWTGKLLGGDYIAVSLLTCPKMATPGLDSIVPNGFGSAKQISLQYPTNGRLISPAYGMSTIFGIQVANPQANRKYLKISKAKHPSRNGLLADTYTAGGLGDADLYSTFGKLWTIRSSPSKCG